MSSSSSLEASLFAQISSEETLCKLLKRLKAIGSEAKEFSIHESVFKPVEGSCIPPPVPSMKPVSLRIQKDLLNSNEQFLIYYGVPEVNAKRKCTVLPMIRSKILEGDTTNFLTQISFELHFELIKKGFEARLGPFNELFIKIFQVMRVPIRESVSTAYPIENGFWIIQLGSECENVQVLAERDSLLHEIGKIFDDLFELKHLENRLFAV